MLYQTSCPKSHSKGLSQDPLVEVSSQCLWLTDFDETWHACLLGTWLTMVLHELLRKNDFLDPK